MNRLRLSEQNHLIRRAAGKTATLLLLVLCSVAVFGFQSDAADGYEIIVGEGGITGTYNGAALQEVYVCLMGAGDDYKVVKPGASGSRLYYFNAEGIGEVFSGSQFVKISYAGKKQVYYYRKGKLVKNRIVGSPKEGYYYVDTTGVRIADKTTKLAVKFVRAHTKSSDSKSKKLKKCYYYLAKHYKYSRSYGNLYPKAKHMQSLAYDMLKNKRGNCHRYAASFAYIARVIGYDAKVVVGDVSGNHGGMTPHGWVEVKNKGKWYVCDPDMEYNNHVPGYMKKSTPCKTSVKRKCRITAKNGRIVWK